MSTTSSQPFVGSRTPTHPRKSKSSPQSRSARAGLQFPVGRVHRFLRKGRYAKRVSVGSAVYLAGVMEYLTAEVLELSGNAAKDLKKRRITPKHLTLAVRGDEELDSIMQNVMLRQGGVIPHIHKSLINRDKKKKKKKKNKKIKQAEYAAKTNATPISSSSQ